MHGEIAGSGGIIGWVKRNRWPFIIFIAALVPRLALLAATHDVKVMYDEYRYLTWANELYLKGDISFGGALAPTMYPRIISAVYSVFGFDILYFKVFQVVISALSAVLVFLVGKESGTEKAGVIAGLLFSFYPGLVWFSNHLWTETVFIFFVFSAIYILILFNRRPSAAVLLGSGVFIGFAALTRGAAIFSLPLLGVWLASKYWREKRRILYYGLALGVGVLVVVVPLSRKSDKVYTGFSGGSNLYLANNEIVGYDRFSKDYYEKLLKALDKMNKLGTTKRNREMPALKEAVRYILNEQPWWFFKKLYYSSTELWSANTFWLRHIRNGLYFKPLPWIIRASFLGFCATYLFVLITAAAGIAYSRRNFAVNIVLGFTIFFVMIHILSHGGPRYRLPAMPALIVFSALALENSRGIIEAAGKRLFSKRSMVFALLVVYIAVSVFMRIGFVLEKYWYV